MLFSPIIPESLNGFVFVEDNNKNLNTKGPWWKQGVELFSEVSTWIAVPMVVALILGKWLDAHYGTKPLLFLILAGLGFLVTIFGLVRVVTKYMDKIKKEVEKQNQNK